MARNVWKNYLFWCANEHVAFKIPVSFLLHECNLKIKKLLNGFYFRKWNQFCQCSNYLTLGLTNLLKMYSINFFRI